MSLPSLQRFYGSAYQRFDFDTSGSKSYAYSEDFELFQTQWHVIDNPDERCDMTKVDRRRPPDLTGCITDYLEAEIGCRAFMPKGGKSALPACKKGNQVN